MTTDPVDTEPLRMLEEIGEEFAESLTMQLTPEQLELLKQIAKTPRRPKSLSETVTAPVLIDEDPEDEA